NIIVCCAILDAAICARAVAAIGVGMMALHQRLEARFDLHRCRTCVETESFERLALDIAHDALLRFVVGIRPRCSTCAAVYFTDNAKRIAGAAKVRRGWEL